MNFMTPNVTICIGGRSDLLWPLQSNSLWFLKESCFGCLYLTCLRRLPQLFSPHSLQALQINTPSRYFFGFYLPTLSMWNCSWPCKLFLILIFLVLNKKESARMSLFEPYCKTGLVGRTWYWSSTRKAKGCYRLTGAQYNFASIFRQSWWQGGEK